jgi:ketosteroid isomerase-like protein
MIAAEGHEAPGKNAKTVSAVFEAFGKGDVAAILERCTDDTEWSFNAREPPVPWQGTYRGKQQLPAFFEAMAKHIDIRAFEPRLIAEGARDVLYQVRIGYVIRRNGKSVNEEQIQWWTLDGTGKVRRLRHYTDTAAVNAAYSA